MIKALIFDLGGVVQGLDWSPVVNALLDLRSDLDIFTYKEAFYHDRPRHFDLYATGEMDAETFWAGVAHRLGLAPDAAARLSESFKLVYSFLNVDLCAMLQQLAGTYELYSLSNACPEIERKVFEDGAYHNVFRKIYFSHEMGCKKPAAAAYLAVLDDAGLKPGECVFVDNDAVNVLGAEAVGMSGVLYRGRRALAEELAGRFGIDCGQSARDGDVGYTSGVFDLFHQGHLNLLLRASSRCRRLIVGVTTDELAFSFKGVRPLASFAERIEIVRALRCVDEAVPQDTMDKYAIWQRRRFDVMFASQAQTPRWPEVERTFLARFAPGQAPKIVYLPYTPGVSSTLRRQAVGWSG